MRYWATFRARFRVLIQYRAAALAGFLTQFFWALLKIMVLEAFFASGVSRVPMSFREVVSYVWVGQAMLAMLPWTTDPDVSEMVKRGGVTYELLRPVDVYASWYARALALRTAPTVLRAIPILACASLVVPILNPDWGLAPPPSALAFCAWVSSSLGALLLACAITSFMHAMLPAMTAGDGIIRFVPSFVLLCSGMVVPLPLFPDWLQTVLNVLPFRWLVDMPLRVYSGHVSTAAAFAGCAYQLLWTALFVVAGRWLLGRGLSRNEFAGG